MINTGSSLNGIEGPNGLYLAEGRTLTGYELDKIESLQQNNPNCPFPTFYYPDPITYQNENNGIRLPVCFNADEFSTFETIANPGKGEMAVYIPPGYALDVNGVIKELVGFYGIDLNPDDIFSGIFEPIDPVTSPDGDPIFFALSTKTWITFKYTEIDGKDYAGNDVKFSVVEGKDSNGDPIYVPIGQLLSSMRYSMKPIESFGFDTGYQISDEMVVYSVDGGENSFLTAPVAIILLLYAITQAVSIGINKVKERKLAANSSPSN